MNHNRKPNKTEPKIWQITRRIFLQSSGLLLAGCSLGVDSPGEERIGDKRPKPLVRFGLITDLHYADAPAKGKRHYRQSLDKLAECVDLMNRERVDFLVELGDLKDQDTPPVESRTLAYLKAIEKKFMAFKGPRYHALGNHDLDSISKKQFQSFAKNTGIAPERSYYSFNKKDLHFIVLDPNFRGDGVAYERGNYDWTDTLLPPAQLQWLAKDLKEARNPAVVFVHQPLDGSGKHHVGNSAEVREVLQKSGKTLAVFQGHNHEGDYNLINNIHYYTLKAAVDGPGPGDNAYVVVEVFPDGALVINAFRKAVAKNFAPV